MALFEMSCTSVSESPTDFLAQYRLIRALELKLEKLEYGSAFAVLKDHPDVLNVCGDPLITTNQVRIIE